METLHIILQHKHHAWYVVAYDAELADGRPLPGMPPPPTRKFISQQAANNYVGRVVLSRVKV